MQRLQRIQPRRVHVDHPVQIQHHDVRQRLRRGRDRLQLADRPEEDRAERLPRAHPAAAGQRCHLGGSLDAIDTRDTRHPVDEEEAGQQQPELHRHRQVEDDGQAERGEQHRAVVEREATQPCEGPPVAHVEAHEQQDARQHAHRDVDRQRGQQQHEHQQRQRMHETGDGRMGATADVGDGTGNGAGHGNAAEQRRGKVGDALGHQLLVGIVTVMGHAVGHPRAQQRFDGPQEGNGQRGAHQVLG